MLSSSNRLTSPVHFREVVRRGRRCGGPLVVVHLLVPAREWSHPGVPTGPRAGFVVSRAVGPAVTRNLVKRRLRHLTRERMAAIPSDAMLVVRALPGSGDATYDELAAAFDACLERCLDSSRSGPRRPADPAADVASPR